MSQNQDDIENAIDKIIGGWVTENSRWVRYHHRNDARHKSDSFGDSIHHTGIFFFFCYRLNQFWSRERQIFEAGFWARLRDNNFYRDTPGFHADGEPWADQYANRDQMKGVAQIMTLVMGRGFTEKVVSMVQKKKWWEFLFPNHRMFFRRAALKKSLWPSRVWADCWSMADAMLDKRKLKRKKKEFQDAKRANPQSRELAFYTNGVDSSILKTVMNNFNATDFQPTFMTKKITKYIAQNLEPQESFTRYFSFVHDPSHDNAPPIHLVALPCLDEQYAEFQ